MEKEKEKTTKKNATKSKTVEEKKKSTKVVEKKEKEVKEKKSKKKSKKEKKKRFNIFKAIFNFFKGVKDEMSKVVWPTRRDMVKYSIATIIFVVVFALYFYGIEVFMAWLKSVIVII